MLRCDYWFGVGVALDLGLWCLGRHVWGAAICPGGLDWRVAAGIWVVSAGVFLDVGDNRAK